MRWGFEIGLLALFALPATAAECPPESRVYMQDRDNATGWNQALPVGDHNAGLIRFGDFGDTLDLELTINGETKLYSTIGGGTGIQTRAAVGREDDEDSHWFGFYEVTGRMAEGQPDHFMIFDGDLYWPACK